MKTDNVKFVESHPYLTCKFVHPKYWINWVGITLLGAVCLLPRGSRTAFGSAIGLLGLVFAKRRRRRIVEKNLRVCFPDLTDQEVKKRLLEILNPAELLYWKPLKHGFFLIEIMHP